MKYPAYPKYRPSEVDWLGDVPEHWELKRIKRIGAIRYGLGEPPGYVNDGLPFIRATDIRGGKVDLEAVKKVSPDAIPWSRKPQLKLNEILVVRSGAYTGDSAIATSEIAGCIAGYDMVLTVSKAVPRFVAWALLSKYLLHGQIFLQCLRAAQPHLNAEELGGLHVLVPPCPEQRAIVDFLDAHTAKLDTLVAKKRKLIEKLNEKRVALISRTVTRGLPPEAACGARLDPHPNLTHTGIEWLGEVPEHWEVIPISRLTSAIQTGPFGSQLHASDYVNGGVPLINPAHIVGGDIRPEEKSSVDLDTALRLGRHRLKEGDIVMGRRGEIGRCGVVTAQEEGWLCGTGSLVVRIASGEPSYFGRVFRSVGFSKQLELNAVGTTMLNINPRIVSKMFVPSPPIHEQRAISKYLDQETTKIDQMISKVESAIDLVQEYRFALITAAVTGKIDFREAAQPLEDASKQTPGKGAVTV